MQGTEGKSMSMNELTHPGRHQLAKHPNYIQNAPDYTECLDRCRLRAYSSMRRSYSRYVEALTSSRRLIFSMMRLPNPCRISFRIPIFLTDWLRERRGWISGSRRAAVPICSTERTPGQDQRVGFLLDCRFHRPQNPVANRSFSRKEFLASVPAM